MEAVRRTVNLIESSDPLRSTDWGRVGRCTHDLDVSGDFAGTHVIPVANLRWIDLKDAPVKADNTVGAGTHVIRQGDARRCETVKIESSPAIVLIHTIFENGHCSEIYVVATGHPKIGLCRRGAATTGTVNTVGAVNRHPEVYSRAVSATRIKKTVANSHAQIDIARLKGEVAAIVAVRHVVCTRQRGRRAGCTACRRRAGC